MILCLMMLINVKRALHSNIMFLHVMFVENSFVVNSFKFQATKISWEKLSHQNFHQIKHILIVSWTITIKFSSLKPLVWSLEGMFLPVVIAFLPAM